MKVKAKFVNGKFGFYGGMRRRNGDEFVLTDPSHFSKLWMESLEEEKPRRGRKPHETHQAETGEGAE
jgi:hypothetical protein